MHPASLRALFRRVLLLSAASPVALAGCGGSSTSGEGPDTGPETSLPDTPPGGDTPSPDTGDAGIGDAGKCTPTKSGDRCTTLVTFPCGLGDADDGGRLLTPADCMRLCPSSTRVSCSVKSRGAAGTEVECYTCGPVDGRRPAGLLAADDLGAPSTWSDDASAVGAYFAHVAHLEAASVDAFRVLRDELVANRAPRRLVRAAGRAARDEVRHARMTGAIARRYGGTVVAPRVEKRPLRDLAAIAEENSAEGCVRETFGALTATWQAENAGDRVIAAVMARIARDETRHAALAWEVSRWAARRLRGADGARVRAAQRDAVTRLARDVRGEPPATLVRVAGVPSAAVAGNLVAQLGRVLWASPSPPSLEAHVTLGA